MNTLRNFAESVFAHIFLFCELCILVEQVCVKNNHDPAFFNEELKFGTAMEEVMKCETKYRAKYYRS